MPKLLVAWRCSILIASAHLSAVYCYRNLLRPSLRLQQLKKFAPLASISSSFAMSKRPKVSEDHISEKKSRRDSNSSRSDNRIASEGLFIPIGFQISRARVLTQPFPDDHHQPKGKCVVLWMSRDQRVHDNHAVHYAQLTAQAHGVPLLVVFNLVPRFLEASLRQYTFMIKGLKEVESNFRDLNIPFNLLMGNPVENIVDFVTEQEAVMLVTDFSPLRVSTGWVQSIADRLDQFPTDKRISLVQVDAHNIVPCWVASPKLEYAARTFRGKITPKIPEYLTDIPPPMSNPEGALDGCSSVDWEAAMASLEIDRQVGEVDWCTPGATAANAMLDSFISNRLKDYADKRNDPNNNFISGLSPYIHFGQISVQRVALTLKRLHRHAASVDAFLEEAIVRRELTDNFCFCKLTRRCWAWLSR
jgi:deoxyribodipyrimidine photo-lyase